MSKLDALRQLNSDLNTRLLDYQVKLSRPDLKTYDFSEFLTYHTTNNETSCDYYSIKQGKQSKIMTSNNFIRIICISGKMKITIPQFREEIVICSPNTQLITPKTPYILEALKDSEIISVTKLGKENVNYKIAENQTIYNKI